jgi:hypothetical protein
MLKERTLTPLMQKEDFRYVQLRNPHKIRKELPKQTRIVHPTSIVRYGMLGSVSLRWSLRDIRGRIKYDGFVVHFGPFAFSLASSWTYPRLLR